MSAWEAEGTEEQSGRERNTGAGSVGKQNAIAIDLAC